MMGMREEYRKTFTYAVRRLGKKLRYSLRLAIESSLTPLLLKRMPAMK